MKMDERITGLTDSSLANDPAPFAEECMLPDGVKVEDELERPDCSIRMIEADSFDVMIAGLKRAALGARAAYVHLKYEPFLKLAELFDKLRKEAALKTGRAKASDIRETETPEANRAMTRMQAYLEIQQGLAHASHGARQLGAGHMGEEWLVTFGWSLVKLQDKTSELIKARAEMFGLHV